MYLGHEGGLFESEAFFGEVTAIATHAGQGLEVAIHMPGCCGDYEIRDYSVAFAFEAQGIGSTLHTLNIHHGATVCDAPFDQPFRFEVQQNAYNLRVTPEIDSTAYVYFRGEWQGNIYHTYSQGRRGTALGQAEDATGRVWGWVRMDPVDSKTDYQMAEHNVVPTYEGWMSARYLKRLD